MKPGCHEDDDCIKESDKHNLDNSNEANANAADEDHIMEKEDVALDNYGKKVDMMAEFFPKTDDNPIKYIYNRDSPGRVVLVDFFSRCLKTR